MRADFTLFDEYTHEHEGAAPFDFPVTAFWGTADRRITQEMVQVRGCELLGAAGQRRPQRRRSHGWPALPPPAQGWARFTNGPFRLLRVEGNHLWPLQREGKAAWLQAVAEGLQQLGAHHL